MGASPAFGALSQRHPVVARGSLATAVNTGPAPITVHMSGGGSAVSRRFSHLPEKKRPSQVGILRGRK